MIEVEAPPDGEPSEAAGAIACGIRWAFGGFGIACLDAASVVCLCTATVRPAGCLGVLGLLGVNAPAPEQVWPPPTMSRHVLTVRESNTRRKE